MNKIKIELSKILSLKEPIGRMRFFIGVMVVGVISSLVSNVVLANIEYRELSYGGLLVLTSLLILYLIRKRLLDLKLSRTNITWILLIFFIVSIYSGINTYKINTTISEMNMCLNNSIIIRNPDTEKISVKVKNQQLEKYCDSQKKVWKKAIDNEKNNLWLKILIAIFILSMLLIKGKKNK